MKVFPIHEVEGYPVVRRSASTLLMSVEAHDYAAYLKLPKAVLCEGRAYRRVRWSGQTGLVVYRATVLAQEVRAA